jgi:hypothetical protein
MLGDSSMPYVTAAAARRNLTPPEIARRYGIATAKVIGWIRSGELAALNLATSTRTRPRYSVTLEALEEFERHRAVVAKTDDPGIQRIRRRANPSVKEFF